MCLVIWTVISGERCGSWASCYIFYDGAVDMQIWALLTKSQCSLWYSGDCWGLWTSCYEKNPKTLWVYCRNYPRLSSPGLKAKVSFSDCLFFVSGCLSIPSSVHLLTFHILIFFSRTTGPISTKLGTKHPWVKGIQVFCK